MDNTAGEELLEPPPRLLERLRTIPGYTWDEEAPYFHSAYGDWYVILRAGARTWSFQDGSTVMSMVLAQAKC